MSPRAWSALSLQSITSAGTKRGLLEGVRIRTICIQVQTMKAQQCWRDSLHFTVKLSSKWNSKRHWLWILPKREGIRKAKTLIKGLQNLNHQKKPFLPVLALKVKHLLFMNTHLQKSSDPLTVQSIDQWSMWHFIHKGRLLFALNEPEGRCTLWQHSM